MAYELPQKPLHSAISTSRILHRWVKYQGNKSFICPVHDIHCYYADTHILHFLSTTAIGTCLVHYIAWHSIFHTLHLDKAPWDHINWGSFLFKYSRQNINGCKLVLEEVYCHIFLISQHCNFMLVNFMYCRILIC